MSAEWLVRVSGSSTEVAVEIRTENAGQEKKLLNLGERS